MEFEELIGKGRVSKIYRKDDRAFKVYPTGYPIDWIEKEYHILKTLNEKTNLFKGNIIFHKNDHVLEMPYIEGQTLASRMIKERYALGIEDMIDVQSSIYDFQHLDLDDAFEVFKNQIHVSSFSNELKEKAENSLHKIAYEQVLCHFDFHLENMMYDGKEYQVIDWVNAKLGNKVMDIARSYIILKEYLPRKANIYLKGICKKNQIDMNHVKEAVPLMAFLRLMEINHSPFEEKLIEMIMK